MDTLSELIDAHPARGCLDVHCQWSGRWALPHAAEEPGVVRFHVVVEGNAYLRLPGEVPVAIAAGDIIVLPSGDAHLLASQADDWQAPRPPVHVRAHPLLEWRAAEAGSPGFDMLCGRIAFGPGAETLLAALPRVLHLPGEAGLPPDALRPVVELLRREVQQAAPGARSVVGQLSAALFSLALRHWWNHSDELHGILGLLREPRLRPAGLAMLRGLDRPLPVEHLATMCHLSRASFLRLFAQATGTTPAHLLSRMRMDIAATRLRRGREGLGAIAAAVGFQSESAFIRAFERHKGMSPTRWRQLPGDPAEQASPVVS